MTLVLRVLLLVLVSPVLSVVHAQIITAATTTPTTADAGFANSLECSEAQAVQCLTINKMCYQDECLACVPGYVDWPDGVAIEVVSSNSTTSSTTSTSTSTAEFDLPELEASLQLSSNSTTRTCTQIDSLTVELFQQLFAPLWLLAEEDIDNDSSSNSNSNPEETADQIVLKLISRLKRLKEVAEFVGHHNRKLPPPAYQLSINEFSGDTPREAQLLAGYQLPPNTKEGAGAAILAYLAAFAWNEQVLEANNQILPSKVDWVERGAVTRDRKSVV